MYYELGFADQHCKAVEQLDRLFGYAETRQCFSIGAEKHEKHDLVAFVDFVCS